MSKLSWVNKPFRSTDKLPQIACWILYNHVQVNFYETFSSGVYKLKKLCPDVDNYKKEFPGTKDCLTTSHYSYNCKYKKHTSNVIVVFKLDLIHNN